MKLKGFLHGDVVKIYDGKYSFTGFIRKDRDELICLIPTPGHVFRGLLSRVCATAERVEVIKRSKN